MESAASVSRIITPALAQPSAFCTPVTRATTVQSPLCWSDSADWKLDYCNVQRLSADELQRRRAAFDAGKDTARLLREQAAPTCAGSGD